MPDGIPPDFDALLKARALGAATRRAKGKAAPARKRIPGDGDGDGIPYEGRDKAGGGRPARRGAAKFTEQQKIELQDYKAGNFRPLNAYLRNPSSVRPSLAKELERQAKVLDAAIAKVTTKEPVTVFRGIHHPALAANAEKLMGKSLPIASFQSTSLDEKVAREFAGVGDGAAVFEIAVPAGSRALPMEQFASGVAQNEAEVLLGRGGSMRVVGVDRSRKPVTIKVEYAQADDAVAKAAADDAPAPRTPGEKADPARFVATAEEIDHALEMAGADLEGEGVAKAAATFDDIMKAKPPGFVGKLPRPSAKAPGKAPGKAPVDADGDGKIFDGTPQERAAPPRTDAGKYAAPKDKVAVFKPGEPMPKSLNGVPLSPWKAPTTPEGWAAVPGQKKIAEPPLPEVPEGFHVGSGVIIREPDGRVWLTKPTNGFGGYKHCVTTDALILTRRGWLRHDEVKVGDETLGLDGAALRWTPVLEVCLFEDAEVVRFGGEQWSSRCTPNHRWVSAKKDGSAVEMLEARQRLNSRRRLMLAAPIAADDPGNGITPLDAAVIGWAVTDGGIHRLDGGGVNGGVPIQIVIVQKKARGVRALNDILAEVNHTRSITDNGAIRYYLHSEFVRGLLERTGWDGRKESIPGLVLGMGLLATRAWLNAAWEAEGLTGTSRENRVALFQKDGPVFEAMAIAAYKCGKLPLMSGRPGDMRRVSVCSPMLGYRGVRVAPDGRADVWCVRTGLGTWTMMQGNAIVLTGNTFPKGTAEEGLSLQANAIKEAFEETGLRVEITGFAGDVQRTTSTARYYYARRVGGTPAAAGWESEAVVLAPPARLHELLNMPVDQKLAHRYAGAPKPPPPPPKPAAPPQPKPGAWSGKTKHSDYSAEDIFSGVWAGLWGLKKSAAEGDDGPLLFDDIHVADGAAVPFDAVLEAVEKAKLPNIGAADDAAGKLAGKAGAAANYAAGKGETIVGNLCRGPGGKFVACGVGGGPVHTVDSSKWPQTNGAAQSAKKAIANYEALHKAKDIAGLEAAKPNLDALLPGKGNPYTKGKAQAWKAMHDDLMAQKAAVVASSAAAPVRAAAGWKQTGGQLGSNPGGKFADAKGVEHYVKFSHSEMHAKNEALASRLYDLAGAPALKVELVDAAAIGGKPLSVATKWQAKSKFEIGNPAHVAAAHEDFAVHAWLANWDAVGTGMDNLAVVGGKMTVVDSGGSLLFRAQGAPKGKDFGPSVMEWDTMRAAATPGDAPKVFGSMDAAALFASAKKVAAVPDDAIRAVVMAHGPGTLAERKALAEVMVLRKQDIVERANKLGMGDVTLSGAKIEPQPAAVAKPVPPQPAAPGKADLTPKAAAAPEGAGLDMAEIEAIAAPHLGGLPFASVAGTGSKWDDAIQAAAKGDAKALAAVKFSTPAGQQFKAQLQGALKAQAAMPKAAPRAAAPKASAALTVDELNAAETKFSALANHAGLDTSYGKLASAALAGDIQAAKGVKMLGSVGEKTQASVVAAMEAKAAAAAPAAGKAASAALDDADLAGVSRYWFGQGNAWAPKSAAGKLAAAAKAGDIAAVKAVTMAGSSGEELKAKLVAAMEAKASQAAAPAKLSAALTDDEIFSAHPGLKVASKMPGGITGKMVGAAKAGDLDAMAKIDVANGGDTLVGIKADLTAKMQAKAGLPATPQASPAAAALPEANPSVKTPPAFPPKVTPEELSSPANKPSKANLKAVDDIEAAGAAYAAGSISADEALAKINAAVIPNPAQTYGKKVAKYQAATAAAVAQHAGAVTAAKTAAAGTKTVAQQTQAASQAGAAAAQAAAQAAAVAPPQPIAAPKVKATKVSKPKPVFDHSKITAPPDFHNWNGKGQPLSSKPLKNKANADAVNGIYDAAKTGDPAAVKAVMADVLDDKATTVVGKVPVLQSKSTHVQSYAQQTIDEIELQLNPPRPVRIVDAKDIAAAHAAFPTKSIATAKPAEKIGRYVVLGSAGPAGAKFGEHIPRLTKKAGTIPMADLRKTAGDHFEKMTKAQKDAIVSYTGGGFTGQNQSLWAGNPSGAAAAAKAGLKTHGQDIPVGTTMSRRYTPAKSATDATYDPEHIKKIIAGGEGMVLQDVGVISTSVSPDVWGGHKLQLKITVGPGVKGLYVGPGSQKGGGAISQHASEDELILPPDTRFLVQRVLAKPSTDADGFGGGAEYLIEVLALPS